MSDTAKSRRKALGLVNLHVDLFPVDKKWMSDQRKSRGLSWRGYFNQLRTELMKLYEHNTDLEKEVEDKNQEITMLSDKLGKYIAEEEGLPGALYG